MGESAVRRVAIVGFGQEGQAALHWLNKGPSAQDITVFDEGLEAEAFETDQRQLNFSLGPMQDSTLLEFDQIIKSPGIPLKHPAIAAALKAGVEVTSGTNLWFGAYEGERTIGVSGTKGKSTTASLLAHLLRESGEAVELAGNMGRPLLDVSPDTASWVVIELSSYQLADFTGRLQWGLLLNVFSEHLDWHGSGVDYQDAKLRLLQRSEHPLAGPQVLEKYPGLAGEVERWDKRVRLHEKHIELQGQRLSLEGLPLRGHHNVENVCAALAVMDALDITIQNPAAALASFHPLPHRLQMIGQKQAIRFVDDSISTTPESTLAALQAFPEADIVLLVGGFDRGLDWRPVALEMAANPPLAIIGLPDNGPKIIQALDDARVAPAAGLHRASSMQAAVQQGIAIAQASGGDLLLLSPGAPSYGHFRNFQERGEAFKNAIGL